MNKKTLMIIGGIVITLIVIIGAIVSMTKNSSKDEGSKKGDAVLHEPNHKHQKKKQDQHKDESSQKKKDDNQSNDTSNNNASSKDNESSGDTERTSDEDVKKQAKHQTKKTLESDIKTYIKYTTGPKPERKEAEMYNNLSDIVSKETKRELFDGTSLRHPTKDIGEYEHDVKKIKFDWDNDKDLKKKDKTTVRAKYTVHTKTTGDQSYRDQIDVDRNATPIITLVKEDGQWKISGSQY